MDHCRRLLWHNFKTASLEKDGIGFQSEISHSRILNLVLFEVFIRQITLLGQSYFQFTVHCQSEARDATWHLRRIATNCRMRKNNGGQVLVVIHLRVKPSPDLKIANRLGDKIIASRRIPMIPRTTKDAQPAATLASRAPSPRVNLNPNTPNRRHSCSLLSAWCKRCPKWRLVTDMEHNQVQENFLE